MSDLLPCPLCRSEAVKDAGGVAEGIHDWQTLTIECTSCGLLLSDDRCICCHKNKLAELEAKWNTRAPSAPSAAVEDSETLSAVIAEMRGREQVGIAKYGITVDRSDMTHTQWATHLSEELMDALLYLKRMQTSDTNCTCPSGDGSLRWPCPKHPPIHANLDEVARDALTDIVQYGIDNEGFTGEGMAWCIERAWKAKETIDPAIQSAARGEG